jgi:hypothetical protein
MTAKTDIENTEDYDAVSVESTALLCPIFDKYGLPMRVGDRFTYQERTPFSSVVTIEMRNGME